MTSSDDVAAISRLAAAEDTQRRCIASDERSDRRAVEIRERDALHHRDGIAFRDRCEAARNALQDDPAAQLKVGVMRGRWRTEYRDYVRHNVGRHLQWVNRCAATETRHMERQDAIAAQWWELGQRAESLIAAHRQRGEEWLEQRARDLDLTASHQRFDALSAAQAATARVKAEGDRRADVVALCGIGRDHLTFIEDTEWADIVRAADSAFGGVRQSQRVLFQALSGVERAESRTRGGLVRIAEEEYLCVAEGPMQADARRVIERSEEADRAEVARLMAAASDVAQRRAALHRARLELAATQARRRAAFVWEEGSARQAITDWHRDQQNSQRRIACA